MEVSTRLYGAVGAGCGCGVRDTCEDGTSGEINEGDAAGGEGAFFMLDPEEAGEVGSNPGGDLASVLCRRG
jgi:hypothetical protein